MLTEGQVVVTDYPDAALIENLRFNIASCGLLPEGCEIHAEVRRSDCFLDAVAKEHRATCGAHRRRS